MRSFLAVIILAVFWTGPARSEVAPVNIVAPKSSGWTGERIRVLVELRANGSFSGSAGFDLPELPGTLLIKTGNPVVGSREIEGDSWFVQTHEFALFSQKSGALEIPPFPVRFEHREGFTGPARPMEAMTQRLILDIRRPPGSEHIPFLITTEKLEVSETWAPVPDTVRVGDVLRRTILQNAQGLTGMALIPAPATGPEGVRIYEPDVNIEDNTTRGALRGERRDTLTYLVQNSGEIVFPELVYTWWNPVAQTLETKTLPSREFQVEALAETADANPPPGHRHWVHTLAIAIIVGFLVLQRSLILVWSARLWRRLDSPERVAARRLIRACRRHDPSAAQTSWSAWLQTQEKQIPLDSELRVSVIEMQRRVFGPSASGTWNGEQLARSFKKKRTDLKNSRTKQPSRRLHPLNAR